MYCNRAFALALTVLVQSTVALTCSEEFSCAQLLLLYLGPVGIVLLVVVGLVCRRCCSRGDDDEESQYNIVDGDTVVPIWSDGTTQTTTAFTGLHTTDQHDEEFPHRQDCLHHEDFPRYEDFKDHENFTVHSGRPHDDVDDKRINDFRNKRNVHEKYAVETSDGNIDCLNNACSVQSTSFQEPNSSDSEYDQGLVESTYNINGVGKVVLRRPGEQLPRLTKRLSGKTSFVPTLASIEERTSEEGRASSGAPAGGAQSDVEVGGRRQILEGERRANTIEKESGTYTAQEEKDIDTTKERRKTDPAEEEKNIIAQANEMPHLEPLTHMCRTPKDFHKPMQDLSRSS